MSAGSQAVFRLAEGAENDDDGGAAGAEDDDGVADR